MQAECELLTPMEDAAVERPSADRTARFPLDQAIRNRDYEIVARPNVGPVLWRPRGFRRITFTQAQVVKLERLRIKP